MLNDKYVIFHYTMKCRHFKCWSDQASSVFVNEFNSVPSGFVTFNDAKFQSFTVFCLTIAMSLCVSAVGASGPAIEKDF